FERKALQSTQELIDDARKTGAKVMTGGKKSDRFDKGYFFEPTVLTGVSGQAKIMTEEPFAPVMPVLDFSKIDDVIAAANNTRYGLAAYVFTNDLSVMWRWRRDWRRVSSASTSRCRQCRSARSAA